MKLPLIDNTLFIDNTTLERFTTCKRSGEYYAIRKRQQKNNRIALIYGSAFHTALETRYHLAPEPGYGTDGPLSAKMFQAGKAVLDEGGVEFDYRNPATLQSAIADYNSVYLYEDFSIMPHNGQRLVELPFATPIGAFAVEGHEHPINVVWTGRIDLVIKEQESLFILDHKTSSMPPTEYYFNQFANDQAQIGYCWAFQQETGLAVSGFIINAIQTKRPTAKAGPTFDMYRQKFNISQSRIEEWKGNTLALIEELLYDYERGMFPMETKWCVGKYGKCEYFDVCCLDKEQRHVVLDSALYEDVTWNPLTKE